MVEAPEDLRPLFSLPGNDPAAPLLLGKDAGRCPFREFICQRRKAAGQALVFQIGFLIQFCSFLDFIRYASDIFL